jgi:TolB-like protein/Tfp pilus assembly protein PilF
MMDDPDSPDTGDLTEGSPGQIRKKKDKVRSAWISFAGRIIAQVVGAAATIVLGVYVLQRAQSRPTTGDAADTSSSSTKPAPPTRVRSEDGVRTLAVLPLRNLSGDAQQDYFVDGMTEALITDLAQLKGLRVISRTSSMAYKSEQKTVPEIARELDVDLIVEGSVIRAGDRVRIVAQLIDAARDEHLWAHNYDRTMRDILTLQGEVATAIAKAVTGVLGTVDARLASRPAIDPDAYDSYLRGRNAWNRRTREGFEEAIGHFERAIARAPDFALAHAGLADTYQLIGASRDDGTAAAKGHAAAVRALQLDDQLGEAHTSLAAFLARNTGDLDGAEREFRRALDLNAGYPTAHQWYAILLAEEGRDEEAMRQIQLAVSLDPLSGVMHQTASLVHYFARRFDRTIAEARRALTLNPQLPLPREYLARGLILSDKAAEAVALLEASPDVPGTPTALLPIALWRAGDRRRAETLAAGLLKQTPAPLVPLARWYAATGRSTVALETLERLAREAPRTVQQIKSDPMFDALRASPRFAALVSLARATRSE